GHVSRDLVGGDGGDLLTDAVVLKFEVRRGEAAHDRSRGVDGCLHGDEVADRSESWLLSTGSRDDNRHDDRHDEHSAAGHFLIASWSWVTSVRYARKSPRGYCRHGSSPGASGAARNASVTFSASPSLPFITRSAESSVDADRARGTTWSADR